MRCSQKSFIALHHKATPNFPNVQTMIDPKDIAQLAVFLASDAAKSISGQVIPIDNDRQKA